MKHSTYRDLISGSQRGPLAEAARFGLKTASLFYAAAVRIRNRSYDFGLLREFHAPVPVVSIGNLTAGGTGKTPVVAAVVDWFSAHGALPVILSRGYRSLNNAVNDEKLVLDQLCPGIVHLQSPNRVQSALDACRTHGAEVLVLDDGFQHRRLARDLNVVLVDALDPWGAGHLLPRGLLREPRSALKRADVVILTRADQCAPEQRQRILNEIADASSGQSPIELLFKPHGLINATGQTAQTESLTGRVAAFCGIGNPEGFRRTLTTAGLSRDLVGFLSFDDHHHYRSSDIANLAEWARKSGASTLITTQKDLVKIPQTALAGLPLWALAIRAQITAGKDRFDAQLQRLIEARVSPNRRKFQ